MSKKYIADALKNQFGGTVHVIRRPNKGGVTWQATSNESFKKLKEVVNRVKVGLPPEFREQLLSFLANFI